MFLSEPRFEGLPCVLETGTEGGGAGRRRRRRGICPAEAGPQAHVEDDPEMELAGSSRRSCSPRSGSAPLTPREQMTPAPAPLGFLAGPRHRLNVSLTVAVDPPAQQVQSGGTARRRHAAAGAVDDHADRACRGFEHVAWVCDRKSREFVVSSLPPAAPEQASYRGPDPAGCEHRGGGPRPLSRDGGAGWLRSRFGATGRPRRASADRLRHPARRALSVPQLRDSGGLGPANDRCTARAAVGGEDVQRLAQVRPRPSGVGVWVAGTPAAGSALLARGRFRDAAAR